MEYRFYEKRLEQETEKTELGVEYKNISHVYNFPDVLLFVYDKSVIIMDKQGFVRGSAEEVEELMRQNNVKVH